MARLALLDLRSVLDGWSVVEKMKPTQRSRWKSAKTRSRCGEFAHFRLRANCSTSSQQRD